jgi:hypothetical protein
VTKFDVNLVLSHLRESLFDSAPHLPLLLLVGIPGGGVLARFYVAFLPVDDVSS